MLRFLKRQPHKLLLRDGFRIDLPKDSLDNQFSALTRIFEADWKVNSVDKMCLTLSDARLGIHVKCRYKAGNDIGHLIEIILDQAYGAQFEDEVVLDIGMSNGDSAIYFAKKGARLVVGLEPYSESFDLAVQNIRLSGVEKRIIPLKLALSSTVGTADLSTSTLNPNANSLSPSVHIRSKFDFESTVKAETVNVGQILESLNLNRIDLMKLDCEGCEYDVIRNMGPDAYDRIGEIILEFHDGLRDLPDLLHKNGFVVNYSFNLGLENNTLGLLRASRTIS